MTIDLLKKFLKLKNQDCSISMVRTFVFFIEFEFLVKSCLIK